MASVIPHLAWPFRFDATRRRLAVVEQDTIDDVQQNVHAYLNTDRGERSLSPDFGLADPTFGPGVDTVLLASEIEQAEDRAVVEITATPVSATGRVAVNVSVDLAE